jgi:hypothetical protein
MKRESRWKHMIVGGREVSIQHELSLSTADCHAHDYLWHGNRKLCLDTGPMPPKLARLLPSGYATPRVEPKHWEPFVNMAVSLGML